MKKLKLVATQETLFTVEAEAVVLGIYSDGELEGIATELDKANNGLIARLIESKEFTAKSCELIQLYSLAEVRAPMVVLVGLGPKAEFNRGEAFRTFATASRLLAGKEREKVAFFPGDDWKGPEIENAVAGIYVGCEGQDLYKTEKKRYPFKEVIWPCTEKNLPMSGDIIGRAINMTRRLINEPAQKIVPEVMAQRAKSIADQHGMEADVWDEQRLEAGRCGALLAVGRGSVQPPRLVILRYQGAPKEDAPTLALVGKGVTFDSGGLSLKPSDSMKTMKSDMSGAATVLGAMQAIAQLELPINVICLFGLVENMPGGNSYKLGDVLTARNGKTVEVLNTDAEGRLVLADVLSVAVDQKAAKIVDVATLTGACVVALGTDTAGLMTNDQSWCDQIAKAADQCGERAWQLPMFPEFGKQIKSDVADIKNIGEGRWGGAITAAKFLEEFVADIPWTHIDIAGPAFVEKSKSWLDGGASGMFVRTLIEVARKWNSSDKKK